MEKYDSSPVFRLGVAVGELLRSIESSNLRASIFPASFLKNHIQLFIIQNPELKLSVDAASLVIKAIDVYFEKVKSQTDAKGIPLGIADITDDLEIAILRSAINDFQTFLEKELPQLNIYYITPHRAYDMATLINRGENLLSPITLSSLADSKQEVIKDIREAARALAFGFSTAVGFHLYRSLEAIIIKDYFVVLGVLPVEYGKNPNLGNYINILHDKGVDVKITSMLRHLKDHYRNPIMHPDEFWDIDNANSAIGLATSLIDVMVQDIQEIKKKGTT